MKIGWLLDADMFDGYRDELVAAIQAQGHEAKFIHAPSPPYRWDDTGCAYRESFPSGTCVVAHGDIELVTRICNERRWTPGAFATVENFACTSYYCHYGQYLLNRDYIMLPFGELNRCQDFLFASLGLEDRLFIRPDSPLKLFAGQIATRQTFAADLEFMGFYGFPIESLVVVSSPKNIQHEWRFVVVHGKVVAGCQYRRSGKIDYQPEYDAEACELAKRIAANDYQPDPVWVLDICQTSDNVYHLLEIGGFSFADLYACNKADIVAAVSAAAMEVWNRSHG